MLSRLCSRAKCLEHQIRIKSQYRIAIHIELWKSHYISYRHLSNVIISYCEVTGNFHLEQIQDGPAKKAVHLDKILIQLLNCITATTQTSHSTSTVCLGKMVLPSWAGADTEAPCAPGSPAWQCWWSQTPGAHLHWCCTGTEGETEKERDRTRI